MGQQMMIIALLGSMLLTALILNFSGSWDMSNNVVASQYEQEQALNVSNGGVSLAISQLRQNKSWRTGFNRLQVTQRGYCNLTVTTIGTDTVRISSTGMVNSAAHTSIVVAKLSSIFPSVEAALQVFGDTVGFTNSGKSFLIDGRDYSADGNTLTGKGGVNGMAVKNAAIQSYLKDQISNGDITSNIIGKDGHGSVGLSESVDSSLMALKNQYASLATITLPSGKYSGNYTYGTLDAPQIVHVSGDLDWTGTITGAGILVVDGKLKMNGNIRWQGIVIAVSGDVEMNLGGTGNPSIIGTALIGNQNLLHYTQVKVNGNPEVKYSSAALETVLAKLGLLAVEVISYYE